MKTEFKTVLILFALAAALGAGSFYISKFNFKYMPLTPYSSTFDIFALFKERPKSKKVIYGYLPYWTLYNAKYLELDRLTDIAYFGLYIDSQGNFVKTTEGSDGYVISEPGYRNWNESEDLTQLITASKKFGVNFALTIIAHSDADNDAFLDCRNCWDTLLSNIETELTNKKIKDINLNFEYAEYVEASRATKFTELTKFLNEALDAKFGDSKVVVSAFADSLVKPRISSDLANLAKSSDGVFIMAYDFHRPTSDNAGPVAPIGGKGVYAEYDIQTMLLDFLKVTSPDKLILGVPYYGYNWVVDSGQDYAQRVSGNDSIGFSQSQSYSDIMDTIINVRPDIKWDSLGQVPYFTYVSPETGQQREVYYENEQSLKVKYSLVNSAQLQGAGIWALGYDGGYTELWNLLYDEFVNIN